MAYKVLVAEGNPILRTKIIDACNSHAKLDVFESVDNIKLMKDYLSSQIFDVVVVGGRLTDCTAIEAINQIVVSQPLPILHIPIHQTSVLEFPDVLNLGFIDTVEILSDFEGNNLEHIKIPRLVPIKVAILAKLNMARFLYQIDMYNKGEIKASRILKVKNKDSKALEKKFSKRASKEILKKIRSRRGKVTTKDVIVIGASTGGPKMLQHIIPQFPSNFPPVLVVQHLPRGFVDSFASRINTKSNMTVKMAKQGDLIQSGIAYIAPGGYHMEVEMDLNNLPAITISDGPTVNFVKPSVDVTLFSAVRIWGSGVISVILTGMGSDGREGTRVVKKLRGRSIALNERDSVIYGMNKSVVQAGLADHVLGMDEVTIKLAKMLGFDVD
jgi:two-component system chemotaxis response regulator CheB